MREHGATGDAPSRPPHATLRLRRIDALRGIAILAVVLLHWFGNVFATDHLRWQGLFLDPHSAPNSFFWIFYPLSFGWIGVPLFFVISGFCIHASALSARKFHTGQFFWRRFWRIYPPYLVAICFAAWMRGTSFQGEELSQLVAHLLLVQNFRSEWIFSLNGVFWSLAVEAQLYLLYPLLWKIRQRWGIEHALKFTLILSLVSRLVAAILFTNWRDDLAGTVWTFPTMLWFDWTLGAFLAERFFEGRRAFPASQALRWFVLVSVIGSTFCKPLAIFTFSLASFFCALVTETYLERKKDPSRNSWLVALGLCSYSLYLIHYPLIPTIVRFFRELFQTGEPFILMVTFPLALLVLFLLSFPLYLVVERTSIAIGRKFGPILAESRAAP